MGMFKKATKEKAKLRAAFFAPSGGGKTYTSLRVAAGLGGSVAVIDSERGSASKYSDRFEFDVCELDDYSIASYCRAIKEAGQAGYDVLIVDSLTHAWKELLEEVDRLADSKYRGNRFAAWKDGTPLQAQLVDAILTYPGHAIATMRSKTEWTTEQDSRGKTKPVRVGLSPEQGKGIEFEFDLLLEMSQDGVAHVVKDRTGRFHGKTIKHPGEDFGRDLAAWLGDGAEPAKPPPLRPVPNPEPTSKPMEASKQKEHPSITYCRDLFAAEDEEAWKVVHDTRGAWFDKIQKGQREKIEVFEQYTHGKLQGLGLDLALVNTDEDFLPVAEEWVNGILAALGESPLGGE